MEQNNIPGLTEDKLDASISIRNFPKNNFYTGYHFIGGQGEGNVDIITGFKPKYVHLESIYKGGRVANSTSDIIEDEDGVLTINTDYQIYNYRDRYHLGSGTGIAAVYVYRDSSRRKIMYISFTATGFTLSYGTDGTAPTGIHIFAMG